MDLSYREILGAIATIIAFIGYIPYFKDIFAGRTKPHGFTWLVWASLTLIGFLAQVTTDGGPGSWVMGFSAAICFIIAGFGFVKGEKQITLSDWLCLGGAALALVIWYFTSSLFWSVILITAIDALGFIPTIRKSYSKPYEETLSTYAISGFKFVISIIALNEINIITALYPASLVLANWLFIIMLYVRRKQLAEKVKK